MQLPKKVNKKQENVLMLRYRPHYNHHHNLPHQFVISVKRIRNEIVSMVDRMLKVQVLGLG